MAAHGRNRATGPTPKRMLGGMPAAVAALVLLASAPAFAAPGPEYDPLTITKLAEGHGKLVVTVAAGPSGSPGGFTVWWMRRADFEANGGQWFDGGDPRQAEASFDGTPTLNVNGAGTFYLGSGESITIEIGDLYDETGVVTPNRSELEYGTEYVVCGYANGTATRRPSDYTPNLAGSTTPGEDCTLTQGFWKTHYPGDWPSSVISGGLTLGTVSYSAAQLEAIFNQPAAGNGLVSMAHQLIAAKLNILNGADATAIAATVAAADALIDGLVVPPVGSGYLNPATTSPLTQGLDDFNSGITGPGHCQPTAARPSSWGALKTLYR